MNIKNHFKVINHGNFQSTALLIFRVIVGLAMAQHGWGKIQTPFGWMPPDAPIPGALQFLAALSEFGGGLAWALGLLSPLASLGIAVTMLVATSMHAFAMGDPWVATKGGSSFEPALGYFVTAILLLAMTPGKYSLDAKIFGKK